MSQRGGLVARSIGELQRREMQKPVKGQSKLGFDLSFVLFTLLECLRDRQGCCHDEPWQRKFERNETVPVTA